MAKGRKTGGRDWQPGEGGRPFGAKDKTPRASIKALCVHLVEDRPRLFLAALLRGIRAHPPASYQYLQLCAHYLDGKPIETVQVRDLANHSAWDDVSAEGLEARACVLVELARQVRAGGDADADAADAEDPGSAVH